MPFWGRVVGNSRKQESNGVAIASSPSHAITVPAYAKMLGLVPAVERRQIAAVLLYCGRYTIEGVDLNGPFGFYHRTVLWSYSGSKDFKSDPKFAAAWVLDHVTADFPPARALDSDLP